MHDLKRSIDSRSTISAPPPLHGSGESTTAFGSRSTSKRL